MKLKKAYIFLFSFLCLTAMFSACYYLSYLHALKDFNKNAVERNQEYAKIADSSKPTTALTPEDNSVAAGAQSSLTIQPSTDYILEIVDLKTNTAQTLKLNPPGYLVGLTKEEVEEYLTKYMDDLTLSEYNKGLVSFDLVKFSDKEFTLRKTYNEDIVAYRFYVVVKNGYVVIYNSDLKSVYKYTQIEAKNLSEDDRVALSKGIYVDSLDELYALLESYTS